MHKPNSKPAMTLESTGIDLVPEDQRTGTPGELFWIWTAANIGILGIVYGAIIVSFELSLIQALLAGLVGVASFALVGFTSFAGKRGRTSTLTLSRVIFGIKGNVPPTAFSWINLLGWEAVNVITGTLTLVALFQALGFAAGTWLSVLSLALFGGLTVIVSLLGQNTVASLQRWFGKVFGALTLVVVAYIVAHTPWAEVLARPSGSWLSGFLPAVSIIAAGTGISWAIAGADYSRFQHEDASSGRIFAAVVGGAALPLLILIGTGVLLSAQLPGLSSDANPIALVGTVLPTWMAVPYLLAATAGIVSIAVLSLYSASLNLLTLGVQVKQSLAITVDALLVLGVAVYVIFISGEFIGPFISFLVFCGVFLSAWEAIFVLDYFYLRRHQGYDPDALYGLHNRGVQVVPLACWVIGAISGLLVSKTGFIDGPLALGIFANSSLGLFVSFLASLMCYGMWLLFGPRKMA
ncbi:purine-cytosine permease family protein [Pseudomonas sp. GL-RE-26]|uniref:purine-cytosine permease family protein n=1 Tax=Pseudomonas sp. GL-RE-26 TaxID=2832390 RepID=UPI001CBF01F9|nr:cytosine permease [Pseudomonas sp. GL-RE-26]